MSFTVSRTVESGTSVLGRFGNRTFAACSCGRSGFSFALTSLEKTTNRQIAGFET